MGSPIGKHGEAFVTKTCQFPFLADFVFPNPTYVKGRLKRELCDAIIAFESTWVVIQIKTADPEAHKGYSSHDEDRWHAEQMLKAASQVNGAVNTIRRQVPLDIVNSRGRSISANHHTGLRLFGLVLVDHESRPLGDVELLPPHPATSIPTLYLSFSEFLSLCTELTTIGDLLDYLSFRLEQCTSVIFAGGGELDLLAAYATNRDRVNDSEALDVCIVEEGIWKAHRSHAQVIDRDKRNLVSYIIDELADRMHRAVQYADPSEIDLARLGELGLPPSTQYPEIVNELARLRRTERRGIGEKLADKSLLCRRSGRPRYFFARYDDRMPMFFLVDAGDRGRRVAMLENLGLMAKWLLKSDRILALATEPLDATNRTIDCYLLRSTLEEDAAELGPQGQSDATKLFGNAVSQTTFEYDPSISNDPRAKATVPKNRFKKRKRSRR